MATLLVSLCPRLLRVQQNRKKGFVTEERCKLNNNMILIAMPEVDFFKARRL